MASVKVSALTATTTATSDDLLYLVDDPGGTPASRKITVANFLATGGASTVIISTTPITSGADTRVLFQDGSVVGEDAGFTYNKTTDRLTVLGGYTVTQTATATGTAPTTITLTPGNHTATTAATEVLYGQFGATGMTLEVATGALALNRSWAFFAPTISFVGASTATTVATVQVVSNPAAGTNATFTASWAIQAGGDVAGGPTSTGMKYGAYHAKAHTVTVTGSTAATAAGAFSQGRFDILTVTDASAVTITSAATVYIDGAVAQAGSVTITNKYALHVNAGNSFLAGGVTTTDNGSSEFFGKSSTAGTDSCTTVGASATSTSGTRCLVLGARASANSRLASLVIGSDMTATANNQLVIGALVASGGITEGYFGCGVTAASPIDFTFATTGGSGADNAGAAHIIAGGKGTGAGAVGVIKFQTSTVAASSSTLQTLSTRATIDGLGNFNLGVATAGATAAGVLCLSNAATSPTTSVDRVQLSSKDISAGNATLELWTETAVVTETVVSDRTLSFFINGVNLKFCLKA